MIETLFLILGISAFTWIVFLGILFFTKITLPETWLSELIKLYSFGMFAVSVALFVLTFMDHPSQVLLDYKDWIVVGHYQFKSRFIVDLLGATYALLTTALIGIIFKFSRNYLHKEEGYFRFCFLLSILLFGLLIVSFARSLDLLFAGWELVGTTSVLLIGYFYNQNQPVRHSVKAIVSYRLCDMGILAAAAWAHHYLHTTEFIRIAEAVEHAHLVTPVSLSLIGLFIIWASLAKAGQLPMCSWLPTAMEGPTPSSAIFYGALSIHLGPFLLLRFYDYFEHFPVLLMIIGLVGATSAVYASMVGRTRSDAKTMLAYATISQVGLMYIEIALGLTNFALFHMVAHASLRTFQFLRSSSLLQDFFENPVVKHNVEIARSHSLEKLLSSKLKKKIYIHALNGFHLDHFTRRALEFLSLPAVLFISFEKKCMNLDNKIIKRLLGRG